MPDGVFSLAAPIVGSRNPEAQGKRSRLVLIVDELLAGRGQKTIHSGFVNLGLFIIALALNGPEIAFHRLGNEVYAYPCLRGFPCTETPARARHAGTCLHTTVRFVEKPASGVQSDLPCPVLKRKWRDTWQEDLGRSWVLS